MKHPTSAIDVETPATRAEGQQARTEQRLQQIWAARLAHHLTDFPFRIMLQIHDPIKNMWIGWIGKIYTVKPSTLADAKRIIRALDVWVEAVRRHGPEAVIAALRKIEGA